MQSFVIRTYDTITITNCYNEIFGDDAQIRRQKWIMLAVAAAFILAGALSFMATASFVRLAGFLMLIVGVGMLFAPLLKRQTMKRVETASKDTRYTFTEEGWMVFEDGEHEQHDYSEFIRLQEDKHCFCLFSSRVSGIFLPKVDFAEGDPAAFSEFIARKTGLPLKSKL